MSDLAVHWRVTTQIPDEWSANQKLTVHVHDFRIALLIWLVR